MAELLKDYVSDEPPAMGDNHIDLQNAALRELIKLSTESVHPVEAQIERRYLRAKKAAQDAFNQARDQIERQFNESTETIQQEYNQQVQQIQGVHHSDLDAINENTQSTRRRIHQDTDKVRGAAKKEHDNEIWLADTIAGETRKKLHKDFERFTRKEVPAAKKQLQSLQEQAEWLLQEYRQQPPLETVSDIEDPPAGENHAEALDRLNESAQQYLDRLESLSVPSLFAGGRPHLFVILPCLIAVGLAGLLEFLDAPYCPPFIYTGPIAFVCVLAVILLAGKALWRLAQSQVKAAYIPLNETLARAYLTLDRWLQAAEQQLQQQVAEAVEKREKTVNKAKTQFDQVVSEADQRRSALLAQLEKSYTQLCEEIENRRSSGLQQAETQRDQQCREFQQRRQKDLAAAEERHDKLTREYQNKHDSELSILQGRWEQGLSYIRSLLDDTERLNKLFGLDWDNLLLQEWSPTREFVSVVRFGQLQVDLGQLADSVCRHADFAVDKTKAVNLPALLAFPNRCSLLVQTRRRGNPEAIHALRAVMLRLLTSLPPGRIRFTIIDPVGLGENFAGFMHLADYEEALVGGRIWTESAHIEQRLTDLTNHMENVIQKYLRNEFETIDDYNLQAGELAEPYRFLVVANFPVNFTEEAAHRLGSIVSSGARCGVYTLVAHDARQELPLGIQMDDLKGNSVHLVYKDDRFVWRDEIFGRFPLTLDKPPAEETLTRLMHMVGQGAKDSLRVEVPFDSIAPDDGEYWTGDSSHDINVPVGRTGAIRRQYLKLGRGVAQHALLAGKTGAGKSTLLHVIITNLALWYSPDEIEFYLVDFKKGVEFKTYAAHELVHARAVAIESDREFGLSVLQRLDQEMQQRGDLFRRAGVQDLPGYRQVTGGKMPRTLLVVDEFQVFFSEDDKLAQDAALLLDRLVRQGRAFGIHVLLGSQTLSGASGLARSTMGQMAVRIALQCSEVDSQLILDDNNTAARLLSRPGEAVYNDAGGLVQGNSPFQTSWLSDEDRDGYLNRLSKLDTSRPKRSEPLIVFEGNQPADIRKNRLLADLLQEPHWPKSSPEPRAWVGEPVAIKEPSAVTLRRQIGANLLIVGQQDEAAMSVMASAIVSLAAQHAPESADFYILAPDSTNTSYPDCFKHLAAILPHSIRLLQLPDVAGAVADLVVEIQTRQQNHRQTARAKYLLVFGLQHYRILRRREDDFGFSRENADKPPATDAQFAEILREGPPVGIHVFTWSDTLASLERTLDRPSIRELDNRILFQMSAADSSNLIDSPLANNLGFYRALLCSQEQGIVEKFRPYALVEENWLKSLENKFKSKMKNK